MMEYSRSIDLASGWRYLVNICINAHCTVHIILDLNRFISGIMQYATTATIPKLDRLYKFFVDIFHTNFKYSGRRFINTMRRIFDLSFDFQQAYFKLQVSK